MKPSITQDEVLRIAALAQLDLDAASVEDLRSQLESILDYVAMLDGVETGAGATTDPPGQSRGSLRPDEPGRSLLQAEALRNAPEPTTGHFGVPPVIKVDRS